MLGKASEINMEEINVRDWSVWKAKRPNDEIVSVQYTIRNAGNVFALIIYKEANQHAQAT